MQQPKGSPWQVASWGMLLWGDRAVGNRRPAQHRLMAKGWGTLHPWESCSGPSQGLCKDILGFILRLLSPELLLLLVFSPAGSQQSAAHVKSPMFFQGGEGDGRAKGVSFVEDQAVENNSVA